MQCYITPAGVSTFSKAGGRRSGIPNSTWLSPAKLDACISHHHDSSRLDSAEHCLRWWQHSQGMCYLLALLAKRYDVQHHHAWTDKPRHNQRGGTYSLYTVLRCTRLDRRTTICLCTGFDTAPSRKHTVTLDGQLQWPSASSQHSIFIRTATVAEVCETVPRGRREDYKQWYDFLT